MLGLKKQKLTTARLIHTRSPARCQRKFQRVFPRAFEDPKYLEWERNYKVRAHQQWRNDLSQPAFLSLLRERRYSDIAARAVRIESRTHLLFSFEKMALRDAL